MTGFYNRGRECWLRGTNWSFKSDGFSFVLKGIMSDLCVTRGNVTVNNFVQYCGAESWNRDFSRRTVRPSFLITLIPNFTNMLLLLVLLLYEEHYLNTNPIYWTFSIRTGNLSPFVYVSFFICKPAVYIYIYMCVCVCVCTGCPRRNVPDFGRVFGMLKYTDITQNAHVQSWTVTEIMAREKCGLLWGSTHCTCQLTVLCMPVLQCGVILRQFSSRYL
jgi:hypothetical protein